jgi:hypothetical protein
MNKIKKVLLAFIMMSNGISVAAEEPVSANDLDPQSPELIKTFKVIQGIQALAARVANEAKKNGCNATPTFEVWPGSNPFWNQTKQGLYLESESYTQALYTPWGKVAVYTGVYKNQDGSDVFFNELCKHMKLKFKKNRYEDLMASEGAERWASDYGKVKLYAETFQSEIVLSDLESYRGTDVRILAGLAGYPSLYEIESFGDIELPQPELLSKRTYRSYAAVKDHWAAMLQAYKEQDEGKE